MNYKTIAVAIDFSAQSLKAFERSVIIASNNNATLKLVTVIDTKTFGSIAAYDLKYAAQLKSEYELKLNTLKQEALEKGVQNVEILIEEGSPKVILTTLENVELIICGESGYNQIEKWMLGSVAERIVRFAKCDVLTVR